MLKEGKECRLKSCFEGETNEESISKAILDVIVSGMAKNDSEVMEFLKCTLWAVKRSGMEILMTCKESIARLKRMLY